MTVTKTHNSAIKIIPIKAFSDNYIWAITRTAQANVALVDPGDAQVCIEFLEENQLCLSSLLVTHHHHDHTGGIKTLIDYCQQKKWPLTVYGSASEHSPYCDHTLVENNTFTLAQLEISCRVIDVPGHTTGHIAFFIHDAIQPILFCGDTLFSAGCGRLFEGTAAQMLTSLNKLANLPDNTQVYCTHEYTQANLAFALTVEPSNEALQAYQAKVNVLRQQEQATLPSSIGLEKQINPFLRCHLNAVQHKAQQFDPQTDNTTLATFTTIRRWKDQF